VLLPNDVERVAQQVNVFDKQVQAPISQSNSEEKRPTGHAIATVIDH
jgi:hypothetical protein